jgi:hypothetical protein
MPSTRLTALARAGARLPIRPRGLVVAGLSAASLRVWGYGALDLVALTLGLAGAGLLVAAGVSVFAVAWRVRRGLVRAAPGGPSGRLEAEAPFDTGFEVPLPRFLPLVVVGWRWEEPPGVECRSRAEGRHAAERVTAHARGEIARVVRGFEVADVFGLWRWRWRHLTPVSLRILPAPRSLRRLDLSRSLRAGDSLAHPAGRPEGDRLEIRRYVPGDPARHILWKVWARTGRLNVRLPERSLEEARHTFAYLVAAEGDEPAAAAARVAVETGALGDEWTFAADGTDEAAVARDPALVAIARSGNAPARSRRGGLEAFLARAAGEGARRCIVFAPARPGPWVGEALAAAGAGLRLCFVLGTEGAALEGERAPLWRRALFTEPPRTGQTPGELSELTGRLAADGHDAIVVDRASGRSFGVSGASLLRRSA